MVVHSVDDYKI